jgi:phosphoribosylamine--glycine ligase
MRIAVLGKHAGAHFICQKLLSDSIVSKLYHIGANTSLQPSTKYIPISDEAESNLGVINFLDTTKIDLIFLTTIEFLYNRQIQDKIKEKNIPSCSPSVNNSMLEWSKIFGNEILKKLSIPTPKTRVVDKKTLFDIFFDIPRPWVLKFERDWRAGLQTIVINDHNIKFEFENLSKHGQHRLMSGYFGNFQNQHFLIQEFINIKREYSYHILANEINWQYLGSARDYKKFQENDVGINTAGMGCYSPVDINPQVHKFAEKILDHLKNSNTPYIGVLYLGIAEDLAGNPYVLEINTRPGDPEIETILSCINDQQSIANLLYQTATNIPIETVNHNDKHSVCVRIVHSDYRNIINAMSSNAQIASHLNPQLWPENPDITISYGANRKLLNSILNSTDSSRTEASDKIYKFLENVEMHDFVYRKDIGYLQ